MVYFQTVSSGRHAARGEAVPIPPPGSSNDVLRAVISTMKLTIERAALLKALAHVQSVVERRNTIPILSNVLLNAQKGKLTLSATDMDLAVTESVEANAGKTGSVTAPAHTMYEIVRKLPDGSQVEIETAGSGDTLTLRAGRSRFTLSCLAPSRRARRRPRPGTRNDTASSRLVLPAPLSPVSTTLLAARSRRRYR